MRACGWNVIDVFQGESNIQGITEALFKARVSDKPTFINIRTIIGIGSAVAGKAKAHGAAFGAEDVGNIKRAFGLNPEEHYGVPDSVYEFFREAKSRGQQYEQEWSQRVQSYKADYPEEGAEFELRVRGKMPRDWTQHILKKEDVPAKPTSTRKAAGLVCNPLMEKMVNFMVGTADLSPSVNMSYPKQVDFQNVRTFPSEPLRFRRPTDMPSSLNYAPPSASTATTPAATSTTASVSTPWHLSQTALLPSMPAPSYL